LYQGTNEEQRRNWELEIDRVELKFGKNSPEAWRTRFDFANRLVVFGEDVKARAIFLECLEAQGAFEGKESERFRLNSLERLTDIARHNKDDVLVEELLRRQIGIADLLGGDSPDLVTKPRLELANLLLHNRKFADAIVEFDKTLHLLQGVPVVHNKTWYLWQVLYGLQLCYDEQGDWERALDYAQDFENLIGPEHVDRNFLAYQQYSVGRCAAKVGYHDRALRAFLNAYAISRPMNGINSQTSIAYLDKAVFFAAEQRRWSEVVVFANDTIRIDQSKFGLIAADIGMLQAIGFARLLQDNKARAFGELAIAYGEKSKDVLVASRLKIDWATVLETIGESAQARQVLADTIADLETNKLQNDAAYAFAIHNRACNAIDDMDLMLAEAQFRSVLELIKEKDTYSFTAKTKCNLAAVLAKQKRNEEALEMIKAAQEIVKQHALGGTPLANEIAANMKVIVSGTGKLSVQLATANKEQEEFKPTPPKI
jgi:tetratricopeptide (TPR) repeat protein